MYTALVRNHSGAHYGQFAPQWAGSQYEYAIADPEEY